MPPHRTTATKKRGPFPCAVCKKSYADTAGLNRHLREHDDNYWHKCKWDGCDARFKQRSALVIHDNVHTGLKPYVCPLCGRCFGDPSSLSRHLGSEMHRDADVPLRHRCPQCDSGYERKEQLKSHMRNAHRMEYDNSMKVALPRRPLKEQALAKAAKIRQQSASGSKAPRTTRRSKGKKNEHEAPVSLECRSVIKPEPQEVATQHMDFHMGIPQNEPEYAHAHDLGRPPVPPQDATLYGRDMNTPYHNAVQLPRLVLPPPTHAQPSPLASWENTRRYALSPDGSSSRNSPLMSPSTHALHSLAPSPVNLPYNSQVYDMGSTYQKAPYSVAPPAWVEGHQYVMPDDGCFGLSIAPSPPTQDMWNTGAYNLYYNA
ncbi:unnamed protein product [Peniophora sp. CBMAI 1063]|nr:unnamed protein product [Peniophora sp. CBMAI 1063]